MEVQKCERLRLINSVKARSTVNLSAWYSAASDTAKSTACHKNAVKCRNHRIPAAAWGHDGNAAGLRNKGIFRLTSDTSTNVVVIIQPPSGGLRLPPGQFDVRSSPLR